MNWKTVILLLECFAFGQDVHTASKTIVRVGHCLGCTETVFVERIMASLPATLNNISVIVERSLTDSYGAAGDRFSLRPPATDIIFVYLGQTSQVNEIYDLARNNQLQPVDQLPEIQEKLGSMNFHSNLLEPMRFLGHLWGLPVRISVPSLSPVLPPMVALAATWEGICEVSGDDFFSADHPSDPYLLWRTVCAAKGKELVVEDEYTLDAEVHEAAFGEVAQLMSRRTTWAEAFREVSPSRVAPPAPSAGQGVEIGSRLDSGATPVPLGIVVPDTVINNMFKLRGAKYYEYPAAPAAVYTPENTWYIEVSAAVAPEKLPAITEILAAVTGPEIQMWIARVAFSPPVRPSIANSAEFKAAFPEGSIQRVLAETVPRLRLRKGGPGREEAETLLEEAFNQALERPAEFLPLMSAAVNAANEACFHSAAK